MAIPLTLRVFRDEELVATREFHRDIIKIGRLSSAHLHVDDDRMSRIHAVIEVGSDGAVSIIDMGSVEGTFINGKRVSKAALASGDSITLGNTRLEISIGAEAAAAAPEVPAQVPVVAEEPVPALDAAPTPAPGVEPVAQAQVAEAVAPIPEPVNEAVNVVHQPPAASSHRPVGAVATGPQIPVVAGTIAEAWSRPEVGKGRGSLVRERYEAEVKAHAGKVTRPIPLPTALIDRALQLDVRFSWGDQQLAVGTFDAQAQQVTVGAAAEADIQLEAGNLPSDPFPLARQADGSWSICFADGMSGELIQHGEILSLADLVKRGRARPGDEPGTHLVTLPHDAAAWVDLGYIRAELCFRPTPRLTVAPWSQRLDYQFLNLFVVAFFLVAATIVGFNNAAYDVDVIQDDLHSNNARWAKTLFEAPKPRTNPMMEKLALKAPKDPGEAAPKAAGVEGQAGKKDAPVRNTRSAPRAIDPNDKNEIKNQGILAMLGKGQNSGLSTIFGKGGLGGDLQGAIGGITGNSVGDAHGFGGLGLKGTGAGGGGFGNTIGVGDVGTKGRGGGQGSFGTGVGGLGKKGSSDVQISSNEAVIVGYDRELVRRVVHSHHAQLRYCYESELVRSPNMSGKVTVKWVIGTNGTVSQVSTAATTLGNAKVENCINARVRSWNFPPPKGGGIAVITYPFVFKPSGG